MYVMIHSSSNRLELRTLHSQQLLDYLGTYGGILFLHISIFALRQNNFFQSKHTYAARSQFPFSFIQY